MRKFKTKIAIVFMLILSITFQPTVLMAQTLSQLEQEIDKIVEDTEKQKEEQKKIKAEKANTEAELADVKAEIDLITANIAAEQAKIDSKNAEIEIQKGKIKEIQDKIPEAREEAGGMLLAMQKVENSNVLVQMVVKPTDTEGDNILRRMESVNSISEYAGSVVLDLVAIEKELKFEKTVLDKQLAELKQTETTLETEQANLKVKQDEFNQTLASQSESISDIDVSVGKAAEDQAMMEDTLKYYKQYGCSGDDVVGSKCGGLGDDDKDGVQNSEDSCPNEYGEKANGCPVPEEKDDTTSGNSGNNSGGSSNGGNSGGGNSGGGSSATFARPMRSGVVTCNYGCYSGHQGIDLDLVDYAPILASSTGIVTTSRGGCAPFAAGVNGCNGGYGNYVMVTHYTNNGIYFSLYAHLASINVSQGQKVTQGQQVGTLGDSGNSAGSHLHFELYKDTNGNGIPDDYKSDPRKYVSFPAAGVYW